MSVKAGDVVKLKSGGISMTVERIRADNGKAVCVWFVDGAINTYDFSIDALRTIDL